MATAEDPANSVAAWKRKYYDSLEELETRERQWGQMEDLLRRTISRLTLAADGLDPTLDEQLRALRDAIRDRAEAPALRARIEAMSKTLVKLDNQRAAERALPGRVEILAQVLEGARLPKPLAREAKALRKTLKGLGEDDLDKAVKAFADFLARALAPEAADEGTPGGLLGRLFGSREQKAAPEATTAPPAAEPPPARAEPPSLVPGQRDMLLGLIEQLARTPQRRAGVGELREPVLRAATEAELRRLGEQLAALLNTSPTLADEVSATPTTDVGTRDADDAAVRDLLRQLLERIEFPAEFADEVEALKDRILDTATPLDVDATLQALADLVSRVRSKLQDETREFENFLSQLTDRLADIDEHVRGSEADRIASYENGRELGNAVEAQVQDIASSVRDASDLPQLRDAVQSRIETIIAHIEQHRQVEAARHRAAEAKVRELSERLAALEEETGELRSRVREERNQAMTDTLTGIPNRLAWEERVGQEYARWKRFTTPLALVVWDVDHFKKINDRFGHKAGDKVLKVIANLLADNVRETDFLARYGGEEFVMLMIGASAEDAQRVADKLREAVANCGFHYKGEAVPITISCGVAQFSEGDSIESVFERADQALYRAKDSGRNCCVVADA